MLTWSKVVLFHIAKILPLLL
uniref:Uncharacterized protein n=1 Tax=Rhizophora mucronata TaxID=61149 RepID=A0A2P2P936_RHIMU